MCKKLCKILFALHLYKLGFKINPSQYIHLRLSHAMAKTSERVKMATAAINQMIAKVRVYSEETDQ